MVVPNHQRAPRIQLGEPLPATLLRAGRKPVHGKLRSVSVAGGLLSLPSPLAQGDLVEVAFRTQSGPVKGLAEMLTPLPPRSEGATQAFRLIALGDEAHRALCALTNTASAERPYRIHTILDSV